MDRTRICSTNTRPSTALAGALRAAGLLFALLSSGAGLAQTAELPTFPRDDGFLLLEFDRYSLKLHRPDTTPLLRVYGSGRAEIYYSAQSSQSGLYEIWLNDLELASLLGTIVANSLHQNPSTAMAETAELAAIKGAGDEHYYSSDATVSLMNLYFDGAGKEPVLIENLQSTDRRFPNLPQISAFAKLERTLLKMTEQDKGQPIAAAKSPNQGKTF